MKHFSIEEALRYGWKETKTNFKFLVKIVLIIAVAYIISSWLNDQLKDLMVLNTLTSILFWIIHVVLDIGLIKVTLKLVSGQKPNLKDLYNHYPLFWKYLAGSLLTSLIVAGGLIFLIIPGIIFGIRLQFVTYLIVDKGLGPIEAIKTSLKITQGSFWNLFLFTILMGLINILGAMALVIGLLWTIPTTAIAMAYVYRKFSPKG